MREYEPIAIIGYGCLYPPMMSTPEKLWETIMSAEDGVRDVKPSIWDVNKYYSRNRSAEDKTYCKKTGYIDKIPDLDKLANHFQINLNNISDMNRTQKMILYTILEALRSSKLQLSDIRDASFVTGNMLGDESFANYVERSQIKSYSKSIKSENNLYKHDELKEDLDKSLSIKASLFNIFPSNLLSGVMSALCVKGEGFTVDGACSGSLLAIDEAIKLIHNGNASMCLVTGALGNIGVTGNVAFSKIGALSETEAFPLDEKANGLIPGEGAGTVMIEKLSDALKLGHKVCGIIRGSGVASDGSGQAIYAPSTAGQYEAMKKSLHAADMTINDVDYVEMHATGTPVGDSIELESIMKLVNEAKRNTPLKIGSMKHQIGHSFSAAGMANLFKVLQAFQNQMLPPTEGFKQFSQKNNDIVNGHLIVNDKATKWPRATPYGRVASVNAFGFGGINANIIVQEFDPNIFKDTVSDDIKERNSEKNISVVGQGVWLDKDSNDLIPDNVPVSKNESFPFLKFKMPPRVVQKIDKSQLIGLIAADKAMEQAKDELEKIPRNRIGLYVGAMLGLKTAYTCDLRIRSEELVSSLKAVYPSLSSDKLASINKKYKAKFEPLSEDSLPGFMDNVVAGRISNSLNIRGANLVIDNGERSFETALQQALLSLKSNEYDAVVVGGVNANDLPEYTSLYKKVSGKSEKISNGACFFVLKRQQDLIKKENEAFLLTTDYVPNFVPDDHSVNYLGASGAFQMMREAGKQSSDYQEEKEENGRVNKEIAGCIQMNEAFFNTKRVNEILQEIDRNHIQHIISSTSQMAIYYKDIKDLRNKVLFYKKVSNGGN